MRHQVFAQATSSVEANTAYLVGPIGSNSVHICTFMCNGAFDGALAKLQLGATTTAGTARWNDIASTTLSASGQLNVELTPGFYIRAALVGMSAAGSSDTSVDGWISIGAYIK